MQEIRGEIAMTDTQTEQLTGRALDAAVAEHVIGAGSSAAWDYSARIEPALHAMRHILSRGAWAQNMFYAALWGQAPAAGPARWKFEHTLTALILEDKLPEAICRAAVYVAMQPQWMGSNDSNQCESGDEAEECGE
jgi:hypothetical protein